MPHPRDNSQLEQNNQYRCRHRYTEVGNQEWQGVADAAERGHKAAHASAHPGVPPSREASVIRKRFRKTHAYSGSDGSRQTDNKGVPAIAGGKGRREDRRQGGDGAIHQAGQAGLHDLQHEEPSVGLVLLPLDVGVEFFFP